MNFTPVSIEVEDPLVPLNRMIRSHLAREYHFVASQMVSHEERTDRKVFYFGVVSEEAFRALDLKWDPNLVLIHQVAKDCHKRIDAAVQQNAYGDAPFGVDLTLFERLSVCVAELADNVKQPDWDETALFLTLRRMSLLAYSVSGHGQYLSIRGKLPIFD